MTCDDDSGEPAPEQAHAWSTPVGLLVLCWVVATGLVPVVPLTEGSVDRAFSGAALLVAVTAAGALSYLRPRLRADPEGIAVRTLGGRHHWRWELVSWRVTTSHRFGRTVPVLEIEVPERDLAGGLLLLGRFDLGAEPQEVAERLEALRAR
ncbi:PH domain-containing protein [Actinopolyspora xinjiangensis]|uniref:PH domain-containing protein n=1 Tax=Actinopolyspora xinjiangensis TaxID=405564 RepID=A0A1H0VE03_9ACTN|nr:PH domain-containing protein [Actinopolyspora xinjiangensis]SDP76326.1 PH domain-containing protein [Actinopolyspora xinjiangensis]